ncbi:unnamed protein product, partial [Adineta ricciae]
MPPPPPPPPSDDRTSTSADAGLPQLEKSERVRKKLAHWKAQREKKKAAKKIATNAPPHAPPPPKPHSTPIKLKQSIPISQPCQN